jgi:hypothetical protein
MTICAAWVRKVGKQEELLVASDSRLSGGRSIDYCPKLLVLPRLDCAVCFAGSTDLAYPLMLQLSLATEAHPPSFKRVLDLRPFVTHAVKVFNSMAEAIRTPVHDLKAPNVSFIIGGTRGSGSSSRSTRSVTPLGSNASFRGGRMDTRTGLGWWCSVAT